ncbi:nitroreductase family deazaflavin-dependent oxidoreductase [Nocardia carnea]|uniref:nitroreductase family deazaflavin-dependent oxidoreductase n=1 Tax=Nocardia carnea TaxID=37328 RepID=UPI0024561632|nr:nitroreductase family deazaflavin-dependent oxidoreductase [Nocardia carnea]
MPAPRWIARANKAGLNRITRVIAPWAPGWAVVVHRGRRSGRIFRTPLWAFRRDDGYVIALTYGAESDWVRNVLAAGGCRLETRRRCYAVGSPHVYRDESAGDMPPLIRFVLRRVIKAPEFLRVEVLAELDASK